MRKKFYDLVEVDDPEWAEVIKPEP